MRLSTGTSERSDVNRWSALYARRMMLDGSAVVIVLLLYLIVGALLFGLLYLAIRFGVAHGMRDARRNSPTGSTSVGQDEL